MTALLRRRAALFILCCAACAGPARAQHSGTPAASPTPAVFLTRPGQFEIIGPDPTAAAAVTTLAGEAWRLLEEPLALPRGFSSPVFVRLIPAVEWHEPAAFQAVIEPGGIVTVRIRWESTLEADIVRRALVQALLLRLAVTYHGHSSRLTVPLWLEQGAVGWWVTRAQPARLDGWQQEAETAAVVPLARLLAWKRGDAEPRAWQLAALWWFSHLQDEAGRTPAWRECLRRVLAGGDVAAVLAACYPTVARAAAARELWWLVGQHHQRRLKAFPLLSAAESRAWLAELPRAVFARDGADVVLSLDELFATRAQPVVAAEIERRVRRIERELPWLNPLYRNAALSLGAVLEAIRAGDAARFAEAKAQLARDAHEGRELEDTMHAALDALEVAGPK